MEVVRYTLWTPQHTHMVKHKLMDNGRWRYVSVDFSSEIFTQLQVKQKLTGSIVTHLYFQDGYPIDEPA